MRRRRPRVNGEASRLFHAGYRAAGGRVPRAASTFPARRPQRRWRWRRTLVAGVLLYSLAVFIRQEMELAKLAEERARYESQLAAVQEEGSLLRQRLSELRSPSAIEREARAMGMTKPGEVVYEPLWPSN